MAINLSKASKMPAKSWSLEAGKTCPGAIDPVTKKPVPVCAGCYAKEGFYHMPDAKRVREENREDWKREDWVSDMVKALKSQKFFRWFDSGDVYHPLLAAKILEVMVKTPHVKHWLPTKSYKIARIRVFLEMMKALDNVSVRYSSDAMDGSFESFHGSTVVPFADSETQADKVCDAYERKGKCGDCRACWDKTVNVVAYPSHGHKMKKLVKGLAA